MAATKRKTWTAALEKVSAEVSEQFPADTRAEQLVGALGIALLALDNLHDYPHYTYPNI